MLVSIVTGCPASRYPHGIRRVEELREIKMRLKRLLKHLFVNLAVICSFVFLRAFVL